jgi:hypothetical protein
MDDLGISWGTSAIQVPAATIATASPDKKMRQRL